MKHTLGNNQKPPTSRDGIEAWLDVLTSMLSLPPAQRTQVRDELEDHLRSRVDDLLVLGKSEAEAIRTAISELGETAQLARQISNASRTPKSFRRFAMNATFFVLAGSILTASVSMMMPNNTHTPIPAQADTLVVEDAERPEPIRKAIHIEEASAVNALSTIAETFGMKFRFSDGARRSNARVSILQMKLGRFEGEFTRQEAIDAIESRLGMNYGELVLAATDDELVLMTLEEHRRDQIEIRAYPIPDWAESSDEQYKFSSTMQRLLGTKHNLEYATIQPVNGSLVVAAPPAVHAEIIGMASQLKAISESMLKQKQQKRCQQQALMAQRVERLRAEYEAAKKTYFAEQEKLKQLELEIIKVNSGINLFGSDDMSDKEREAIHTEINDLKVLRREQEITVDEAKARFERLQIILIDREAELILSEFNDTHPVQGMNDPKVEMPTVSIMGTGHMRSGVYMLPEAGGLTLSRFLRIADVQGPDDRVSLQRDGVSKDIGIVRDIISGSAEPITLQPNDQVVITAVE